MWGPQGFVSINGKTTASVSQRRRQSKLRMTTSLCWHSKNNEHKLYKINIYKLTNGLRSAFLILSTYTPAGTSASIPLFKVEKSVLSGRQKKVTDFPSCAIKSWKWCRGVNPFLWGDAGVVLRCSNWRFHTGNECLTYIYRLSLSLGKHRTAVWHNFTL